jgi:hypothetical protein
VLAATVGPAVRPTVPYGGDGASLIEAERYTVSVVNCSESNGSLIRKRGNATTAVGCARSPVSAVMIDLTAGRRPT